MLEMLDGIQESAVRKLQPSYFLVIASGPRNAPEATLFIEMLAVLEIGNYSADDAGNADARALRSLKRQCRHQLAGASCKKRQCAASE